MGLTSTFKRPFDRHTTTEIAALETEAGVKVYDTTLGVFKVCDGTDWIIEHTTIQSVAELETAVAAMTAGQFLRIKAGTYNLTEEMEIPLAADAGGLIGLGAVTINGANGEDSAIKIDASDATATFEFTFGGQIEIKGGTNKIGLWVVNGATTQKVITYVEDAVHFVDNGSGKALVIANTGTGAMKLYANLRFSTGWDSVDITNKTASDRWRFSGVSFDEDFDVAVVAVADNWKFENCQLKHAGMDGGHANNVVNVISCFTFESATVALADASDFPNAFNPTFIPT